MELEKIGSFSRLSYRIERQIERLLRQGGVVAVGEGKMKRHYATEETNTAGRILLRHQVTICDSAPRLSG
jgi:hypothetical protein